MFFLEFTTNVLGIATTEFDVRKGKEICTFLPSLRHAVGPTEVPVQWTRSALSPGAKRSADHSPPSSVEAKNGWSYMYTATSPIRLHGMQRDRLTFLPLRVLEANILADMNIARNVFWKDPKLRVCTLVQFIV